MTRDGSLTSEISSRRVDPAARSETRPVVRDGEVTASTGSTGIASGDDVEGTVVHDEGVILEADQRFAEIFGFEESRDVVGASLFDLISPQARGGLLVECTRRDGTSVIVETTSTPVEFDGR